ncbi:MAG: alpha/beta fold hydrolase, partial [Verrucomicrobiales bacterium]
MNEDARADLANGRTLSYAEYGDPHGQPILFFHGWPSSRYQAAYLDEPANARGLRILAPDRPGIGLSTPQQGRGFQDWPTDISAFADHLGIDRFSIFGISGGGPYTLATCHALADRVVTAAVVCGAPPLGQKEDRGHMHWAYKALASSQRLRRTILPALLPFSRWMVAKGTNKAPMSWMLQSIPARDREALHSVCGWDMVARSFLEAIRNGPDSVLGEGELYLKD